MAQLGAASMRSHTGHAVQVDPERNLLYVKGQVPGHKGNFVFVRDAVYKTKEQPDRPLPTIVGSLPPVTVAQAVRDPFAYAD